jgi:hypothetical protein
MEEVEIGNKEITETRRKKSSVDRREREKETLLVGACGRRVQNHSFVRRRL